MSIKTYHPHFQHLKIKPKNQTTQKDPKNPQNIGARIQNTLKQRKPIHKIHGHLYSQKTKVKMDKQSENSKTLNNPRWNHKITTVLNLSKL